MIEVVEWDPQWPSLFESLRRRYVSALAAVPVVSIEHVGSTAVPGLAAKPIIDIDIVVTRPSVEAAIAAMGTIGFASQGQRGIPDRWALAAPPESPATNTYVVVEGCLALRNHLGVRDVLRNDDAVRREYASLKRALAKQVDDIDHYVTAKSPLLSVVLEAAGLSEDERGEIASLNGAD